MRIAIVGGSGFIGTRTAIELMCAGHDVTIIDIKRITVPVVEYVHADATNYMDILQALDNNFDVVYMLAAISDSSENKRTPLLALDRNIMALANVLQAIDRLKINRIIFSSTVWVYSVAEPTHVNEQTPLIINHSDHIYTTSKLTGETLIRNYHDMCGVNYTILRYGIAYGPGCHPDTILSKFMYNAFASKPLKITGNGSIHRNFLNVKDHARGNLLALKIEAENQTINLEGPEKITLARVADRVKQLHGDVEIIYTDQRSGDYTGKCVCNNKSKQLLGWSPSVDFITGTQEMYDHVKKDIDSRSAC